MSSTHTQFMRENLPEQQQFYFKEYPETYFRVVEWNTPNTFKYEEAYERTGKTYTYSIIEEPHTICFNMEW